MSAEVSFTKRAAAELSRCFNGLTVNRAGNSGSTTGSVASSTNSSKKSTTSSTGSASGPSTSSSTHSTSSTASSSSFLLNQEVIVHNNSSSSKYSKDRKDHTIESSVSETTSLLSKKSHHPSSGQSNSTTTTNKSSAITIMRDGISIPNSVQTLITKANTSLSPFKHHSLGNRQQQQNDSSSNGHHHHFAKGCKSTCSSSKNENSQCPSTPSRRPPPPVHRKTSIARRKNFLLSLQKPSQLEDLVRDFNFLHEFFSYFSSKERTVLAQVCLSPSESPPLSMQLANCPKCVLCLLVSAVMSLRHAQALHLFLEFKEFYSCFSSHESFQFSIYRRVNFSRLPWSSLLRETTQVERHARQR